MSDLCTLNNTERHRKGSLTPPERHCKTTSATIRRAEDGRRPFNKSNELSDAAVSIALLFTLNHSKPHHDQQAVRKGKKRSHPSPSTLKLPQKLII